MKGNSIKNERSSIEEYVKILERFSNENVIYGSTVGMTLEKYKDLQLSAEHILSDYKRVLKENEELKGTLRDTQNSWFEDTKKMEKLKKDFNEANNIAIKNMTEYVSKAEIKDKIEDLKMSGGSDGKDNTENTARELAIEALQDILEESEEK